METLGSISVRRANQRATLLNALYVDIARSSMPSGTMGATIAYTSEAGPAGRLATLESKTC
jgi:hypothetical protein